MDDVQKIHKIITMVKTGDEPNNIICELEALEALSNKDRTIECPVCTSTFTI